MTTTPKEKAKAKAKPKKKVEKRGESAELPSIPAKQVEASTAQLENEIGVLEGWLNDLKETREDNSESILAKTTYTDMLLNRQELLNTLKK